MDEQNKEIFVGEFTEDQVLSERKFYKDTLAQQIEKNNVSEYKIRTELVEHKGLSYYFRNMRVWLVVS